MKKFLIPFAVLSLTALSAFEHYGYKECNLYKPSGARFKCVVLGMKSGCRDYFEAYKQFPKKRKCMVMRNEIAKQKGYNFLESKVTKKKHYKKRRKKFRHIKKKKRYYKKKRIKKAKHIKNKKHRPIVSYKKARKAIVKTKKRVATKPAPVVAHKPKKDKTLDAINKKAKEALNIDSILNGIAPKVQEAKPKKTRNVEKKDALDYI